MKKIGISLIVLIITIIVMIILAGSVILSLSSTGIINKANDAVEKTSMKEVQQLASLKWAEEYMAGKRGEALEASVSEALKDYENKYDIEITDEGVSVKEKTDVVEVAKWEMQKTLNEEKTKVTELVITNGTQRLDVGTVVNYMPEGVGPTNYTGGWKILGVDNQGRILIMSSASITGQDIIMGGTTHAAAVQSFLDTKTTLQNAVKDYKDGTIGVEVRSVEEEDINSLTAYDKKQYGVGKLYAYGNDVTYSWNGTDNKPMYSYGNVSGMQLTNAHGNGFTYYDVKTEEIVTIPYVEGQAGEITTLRNDYYNYTASNYLDATLPAYTMAFGSGNYWLASYSIYTYTNNAIFGIREVYDGRVTHDYIFASYANWAKTYSMPAKAVITLASNVILKESETVKGTYDVSLAQ